MFTDEQIHARAVTLHAVECVRDCHRSITAWYEYAATVLRWEAKTGLVWKGF